MKFGVKVDTKETAKLNKALAKLRKGLSKDQTETVLRDFTEHVHERMILGIRREGGGYRYRFRALSKDWLQHKESLGQPSTQLLATEEYIEAIEVKGTSIGLKPGNHTQAKMSYAQLANYLENGTRRMEPIRHWLPTVRNTRKYVPYFWRRYVRGIV